MKRESFQVSSRDAQYSWSGGIEWLKAFVSQVEHIELRCSDNPTACQADQTGLLPSKVLERCIFRLYFRRLLQACTIWG